jgi:hypothetical protein
MLQVRTAASLFVLLGVFGNCTSPREPSDPRDESPPLEDGTSRELSRTQFDDIPVPRGFRLRSTKNESFSFRHGAIRVGRFAYHGRGNVEDVTGFYQSQMGLLPFGWKETGTSRTPEGSRLEFAKGAEACRITVTSSQRETDIIIEVTGS